MDQLADLAQQWGISSDYIDAAGRHQHVDRATLERIIDSLSRGERGRPSRVRRTITVRQGRDADPEGKADLAGIPTARWEVRDTGRLVTSGKPGAAEGAGLANLPVGEF